MNLARARLRTLVLIGIATRWEFAESYLAARSARRDVFLDACFKEGDGAVELRLQVRTSAGGLLTEQFWLVPPDAETGVREAAIEVAYRCLEEDVRRLTWRGARDRRALC